MATPEEILEKIEQNQKRHLAKFDDVEKLLGENEALILEYYKKQSIFDDINEFKKHLKSEFERYRETVKIIDNEEQHDIVEELVENVAKKYPKLVFLGEHIPSWVKKPETFENKFFIIGNIKKGVRKLLGRN